MRFATVEHRLLLEWNNVEPQRFAEADVTLRHARTFVLNQAWTQTSSMTLKYTFHSQANVLFRGDVYATKTRRRLCDKCTVTHLWQMRLGKILRARAHNLKYFVVSMEISNCAKHKQRTQNKR